MGFFSAVDLMRSELCESSMTCVWSSLGEILEAWGSKKP